MVETPLQPNVRNLPELISDGVTPKLEPNSGQHFSKFRIIMSSEIVSCSFQLYFHKTIIITIAADSALVTLTAVIVLVTWTAAVIAPPADEDGPPRRVRPPDPAGADDLAPCCLRLLPLALFLPPAH